MLRRMSQSCCLTHWWVQINGTGQILNRQSLKCSNVGLLWGNVSVWTHTSTDRLKHLCRLGIFSMIGILCKSVTIFPKLHHKAATRFVRVCVQRSYRLRWWQLSFNTFIPPLLLRLYDVAVNVAASLSITAGDELMSCLPIIKAEQDFFFFYWTCHWLTYFFSPFVTFFFLL